MIFNIQDRQNTFDFIQKVTKECKKIVSLVQVGSGAYGYYDEFSDLDFVIALDKDESMLEVMDYMHKKISEKFPVIFFDQDVQSHLQQYFLNNLLEIDIGFGGYDHAAARKPAFKVLFDSSGVVEEKMIKSREWMDEHIFGEKQKTDIKNACKNVGAHLMHVAVAIKRGNFFRAFGELEYVRKFYIDLLGNRYHLESSLYREMDKLPEPEKTAIKSTFVLNETPQALWSALKNLTELIYKELENCDVPITKEMLFEYYN